MIEVFLLLVDPRINLGELQSFLYGFTPFMECLLIHYTKHLLADDTVSEEHKDHIRYVWRLAHEAASRHSQKMGELLNLRARLAGDPPLTGE